MKPNLIVIIGPTASGKTKFAVQLAKEIGGEIISADSRQVYRSLDIGTGKDLKEYEIDGFNIPYHLIDIVEPEYEFNVFDYQLHFFNKFSEIIAKNKFPILVGGTGLYIEAVLMRYSMPSVPHDPLINQELQREDDGSLIKRLKQLDRPLHNTTDTKDRNRLIRAVEIAEYINRDGKNHADHFPVLRPYIIGIRRERAIIRRRITARLEERLAGGMIEEIRNLHAKGLSWERMNSLGLEYRYISLFLQGKLNYEEMFNQLNIRIHQFAKRQDTWFRRMEKKGIMIHWLDEPDLGKMNVLIKEENQ